VQAEIQNRPGGRLNRHIGEEAMSADGTTLVTVSLQVSPHVTANPERPSSHLNQNVRDPSGSGSARMMAQSLAGGEKIWGNFFEMARRALPLPLWERKKNHGLGAQAPSHRFFR